MKQYLVIGFFLVFIQNSFSQFNDERDALILFTKAKELQGVIYIDDMYSLAYHNEDKDAEKIYQTALKIINSRALKYYDELIKSYPKSNLVLEALFEKGNIQSDLNLLDEAKESYIAVLQSEQEGERFKYKSLIYLAQISIEEKNCEKALQYLEESKKYKIAYHCGVELRGDQILFNNLLKKCQ